ncbi:phosphoglucosamine mutase [Gammaproteobacteria bacterium]|nr:phosphoglucosamine mutase [Gammaproteobacteria bacterium]
MARTFFGTDGIRGKVGKGPITPEFMLRLGWALGTVFLKENSDRVLIGKDTRVSGYMFESALQAGLVSSGMNVALLGPMPTPAIAYLTRTLNASAGIVISASHNSYEDNGVKFFSEAGKKLDSSLEESISERLNQDYPMLVSNSIGKVTRVNDAAGRYVEFCKSCFPTELNLRGIKIALDCANGAAYQVAPKVFSELGAEVKSIGISPNGYNINEAVGSTQPDALVSLVKEFGADLGIALDGDGDRLIMVDRTGEILDGDELLYFIAISKLKTGTLQGGVVGTQMTNLGLQEALADLGVPFFRAPVGDRHVMEELTKRKWLLGGETSGHILCLDQTSTGDAIVAALQVLSACSSLQQPLEELRKGIVKYPQQIVNVPTKESIEEHKLDRLSTIVSQTEQALGDKGRVVLRASGTEPVVRVMVEGENSTTVARLAAALASEAEKEFGKMV